MSACHVFDLEDTPPDALLAGLAAVLHRRGLSDTVRIAREDGLWTAEFTPVVTFGTLRAAARSRPPANPAPAAGQARADAWFGTTPAESLPGLLVSGDGRTAELKAAAPDRLATQLRVLVEHGMREPDTAVGALALATAEEEALVLGFGRGADSGAATPADPPARFDHLRLEYLVATHAARTPDAIAVTCAEHSLTYAALEAAAVGVAARLTAEGIGAEDVVGVLGERSTALVAALLGILKTGAAYLGLEPGTPGERLAGLLADAGARVLLTDAAELPEPVGASIRVLPLASDVGAAGSAADPSADLSADPPADPAALAYVSYTSGSTGEPKGVAVPHRAVLRLVRDPDWAVFGPEDVFLHLSPVAFDASTLEIWAALANGARLAVLPPGPVAVDRVAAELVEQGVTVAWLTAGLFARMVVGHLDAFAGLRQVLAGGDVVPPEAVRRLLLAHPHLTFTNGYGPTENTTFTACWTSDGPPQGAVPIGRPIRGTHVAVLDDALRPVPVGVPGELYAGGAGVARGYLGKPGSSAESFVPDPFAADPGARMYRTGDLAGWRPDGSLSFHGRRDRQVKIRGFRVEPGEVEAVLAGQPEVGQAAVVVQQDDAGGRRLLAYVTAPGADDETRLALPIRLRERLRRILPPHLVPWAVLPVAELPLTANGKLDRAALPAVRCRPRPLATPYLAPRTVWEQRLAELWGAMLGVEPVGVEDDFFELGGHSLVAAEFLDRLRDSLGVEVSAQTLFLRPVISELAEEIETAAAAGPRSRSGPVPEPLPAPSPARSPVPSPARSPARSPSRVPAPLAARRRPSPEDRES